MTASLLSRARMAGVRRVDGAVREKARGYEAVSRDNAGEAAQRASCAVAIESEAADVSLGEFTGQMVAGEAADVAVDDEDAGLAQQHRELTGRRGVERRCSDFREACGAGAGRLQIAPLGCLLRSELRG